MMGGDRRDRQRTGAGRAYLLVILGVILIPPLAISVAIDGGTSSGDWPMRGHDAQHSGTADTDGPGVELELAWKYYAGGLSWSSSPIAVDGVVYVNRGIFIPTEPRECLLALDAVTGESLWSLNVYSTCSTPAVVDGTLYVGSGDKNLYATDAKTGEMKWSYTTEGSIFAAPTVSQGIVFFL